MSNIKERILQYAVNKGFKRSKFPEEIGMSYSSFKSNSTNTSINSDAIGRITSIFPEIDLNWLITGKETKIEKEKKLQTNEPPENYGNNYREKYIEILEENRELQKKVINLLEIKESLKKHSK
jgi:hypothetical protein